VGVFGVVLVVELESVRENGVKSFGQYVGGGQFVFDKWAYG
jgi:hypothetical protein